MIKSGDVVAGAALVIGLIAIVHWRRQGRPLVECLGLHWDRRAAADLAIGLAIGACVMFGIFGCELWTGGIVRDAQATPFGVPAWQTLLLMFIRAPEEEILNRSLLLSGLAVALRGRSTAAILLSAVAFGLEHLTNPGANAVSALGNALGGVVYGYAFVLSGRIWLPVGLHLAWNFVQGPVLGFPVSGQLMGGLQTIHDVGPTWLTGGSYGPESGLVGILFRFVALGLVLMYVSAGYNNDRRREFQMRVAPGPRMASA